MRIAEALSKMKLQPFATEADVEEALRLFQVSTLDAALSGTLSGERAWAVGPGPRGLCGMLQARNVCCSSALASFLLSPLAVFHQGEEKRRFSLQTLGHSPLGVMNGCRFIVGQGQRSAPL